MKVSSEVRCLTTGLLLALVAVDANGADKNPLALESLLGKFEGTIQVDKVNPVQHAYQTEVVAVDGLANTVSLTASCLDCGIKRWKRSKCEITGAPVTINFICRGPASNEEYIFDGENMKATGFGNKFPYSISVTKVSAGRP